MGQTTGRSGENGRQAQQGVFGAAELPSPLSFDPYAHRAGCSKLTDVSLLCSAASLLVSRVAKPLLYLRDSTRIRRENPGTKYVDFTNVQGSRGSLFTVCFEHFHYIGQ